VANEGCNDVQPLLAGDISPFDMAAQQDLHAHDNDVSRVFLIVVERIAGGDKRQGLAGNFDGEIKVTGVLRTKHHGIVRGEARLDFIDEQVRDVKHQFARR
jgi:hypothetical protein